MTPLHLSQGALNLLEVCPRKFQYVYLEQLSIPPSYEQQERLNWGTRFHRLMQQHELGLIDDRVQFGTAEENQLQACMRALVEAAPDLFQENHAALRQSEHRRALQIDRYLLTVVYDLLILEPHQAQILDWKTHGRPPQSRWLAQNWQTRLYLFVLAETSSYRPEQLSMTYWFVQAQPNQAIAPQSFTFPYSSHLHQQTRHDLMGYLKPLERWLSDYDQGYVLPMVDATYGHCQTCSFAVRCQRDRLPYTQRPHPFSDVADIAEVVP